MNLTSADRAIGVNGTTDYRFPKGRAAGFTLIELLVVMAIIAILVSILIPAISGVRKMARITQTRQEISRLQGAIEHYYHDWNSYPGPINTDIIVGIRASSTDPQWPSGGWNGQPALQGNITQAENLVLGLNGGLHAVITGSGSSATVAVQLDLGACYGGNGPYNCSPFNNQQWPGYMNMSPGELTNPDLSGNGFYHDAQGRAAIDSNIPEFIDHFNVDGTGPGQTAGSPILYMRARGGATGVISDSSTGTSYQYDIREITPYTTTSVGIDRTTIYTKGHGLQQVSGQFNSSNPLTLNMTDSNGNNLPNDALPYLLANCSDPSSVTSANQTGTPREVGGYILISAGPDRVYGTIDDICNFGSLHP